MEKQLNKVQNNIAEKENDIKKLKHEIDRIESVGKDNSSHLELGPTCSRCHQCLKHKSSKCQHDPCSSWLQCGRIVLHKSEKKQFESKKGNLKNFLHDLNTLESEAKRLKEVMDSEVRSFNNVVKPHLIRSNLSKYLTSLNRTILPVTRTINIDLAIIKKHYDSQVPNDIEEGSKYFADIILAHNERFEFKETSASQKLSSEMKKVKNKQGQNILHQFLPSLTSPFKKRPKPNESVYNVTKGLQKLPSPSKTTSDTEFPQDNNYATVSEECMMTLIQETPKGISKQSLRNNSPYNEWTDFQCIDHNASISCDSYMYTNNGVHKFYDSPEQPRLNCEKLSKISCCSDINMVPWMNMGLMPEQNQYFPPPPPYPNYYWADHGTFLKMYFQW